MCVLVLLGCFACMHIFGGWPLKCGVCAAGDYILGFFFVFLVCANFFFSSAATCVFSLIPQQGEEFRCPTVCVCVCVCLDKVVSSQ